MFMASNAESKISTDHDEIRAWAEARHGQPACVKGTGKEGDVGLLRLDFPGFSGADSLQHITWEEFFEKFDEQGLALLHQEQTAGGAQSNFNKLISRETAAAAEKKAGSKKVAAKKTPAKKAPAKKVVAKKAPAKKSLAKKTPAKKAVVKKAAGKKSPARKATAKKAAKKTGRR